jgi:serine/threonine protein phosphatase PrpC
MHSVRRKILSHIYTCLYIRNEISAGMTAEEAARALCDLALRLGSSDNISAIVVIFEHS